MAKTIRIDQLAAEITLTVQQYTDSVSASVEKEIDDTAKKVVKEIQDNSPQKTGEYKKGWTRRKDGRYSRIRHTIFNRRKPTLAHLLEFGHAKVGGGRVPAQPTDAGHIRPAYDRHVPGMEKRIKEIVRRGG